MQRSLNKKTVALVLALVLILGASIGGTLAYLITSTETVTNTFTVGDIGELTLTETKPTDKKGIIVPGVDIEKDPKVSYTVADDDDVAVYIFVKITAGENWTANGAAYAYNIAAPTTLNNAMTFSVDSAWTQVPNTPGVFYKELAAKTPLNATSIIAGDKITVSQDITKEQLRAAAEAKFNLDFTAYAIQKQNSGTIAEAYAKASATP